jgi:hypothetical protein
MVGGARTDDAERRTAEAEAEAARLRVEESRAREAAANAQVRLSHIKPLATLACQLQSRLSATHSHSYQPTCITHAPLLLITPANSIDACQLTHTHSYQLNSRSCTLLSTHVRSLLSTDPLAGGCGVRARRAGAVGGPVGERAGGGRGLHSVHFSAQRKHFLWDERCLWGV